MMGLVSVTYQLHLFLLRKDMLTCICKNFLSLTLITKTFLDFDILENAIFTENPPINFIFNFVFIKSIRNICLNIILITSLSYIIVSNNYPVFVSNPLSSEIFNKKNIDIPFLISNKMLDGGLLDCNRKVLQTSHTHSTLPRSSPHRPCRQSR